MTIRNVYKKLPPTQELRHSKCLKMQSCRIWACKAILIPQTPGTMLDEMKDCKTNACWRERRSQDQAKNSCCEIKCSVIPHVLIHGMQSIQ